MKTKQLSLHVSNFKYDQESGEFECYGNVKGNIDHALDKTAEGAYVDSIKMHKQNGTMPKMFWMHKSHDLPVGVWLDMKEDAKGLWMKGKLSKTTMGSDIEILAKDGALDTFSIGYNVIEEKWNGDHNDLIKVHIVETSWVTFGCNDKSTLIGIKSALENEEIPTKRELEKHLRESGLSRKEAATICSRYDDKKTAEKTDDFDFFTSLATIDSIECDT